MVMNKKGMGKKNFLFIFGILIISGFLFLVFAADGIFIHPSVTGTIFTTSNVNEDVPFNYSIALNASLAPGVNITQFNITLPTGFSFTYKTNGSTLSAKSNFTNTSNILTWTNSSLYLITNGSTNNTLFWFNATAIDPGNYNFTVVVLNQSAAGINNVTYFNVSVSVNDTTSPDVHVANISSGTVNGGNYSGTILLNVSLFDNLQGGTAATKVYFNVTNKTASVQQNITTASTAVAPVWNATFNTATLGDGLYNITIWANDSNRNMNNSAYVTIRIDNTAPTGSITCSPTTVTAGDTVTCSCSATDAGSGVLSTSYTTSPSTVNTGTFTQSCSFSDYAGLSSTATSNSYTVNLGGSSSGSSGGSSGSGGTTAPKTSSWTKITPGAATIMKNFDVTTGVKEIQIEVNNEAQNVKITVTKYESKPAEVSVEKSGSYKYLKVDTQNLAGKLSKAKMKIHVEKSWVSSKGVAKEDVALFRYDESGSKWNELTTTYDSEDDTYYYYTAETSEFSYFAIASKETALVTGETPAPTPEQPTPSAGFLGLPIWVWIIIGLVILAAIIGGGVVLGKKKRK